MESQDSVYSVGNMNIANDTNLVIPEVSNVFHRIVEIWVNISFKKLIKMI